MEIKCKHFGSWLEYIEWLSASDVEKESIIKIIMVAGQTKEPILFNGREGILINGGVPMYDVLYLECEQEDTDNG